MRQIFTRLTPARLLVLLVVLGSGAATLAGCGAKAQPVGEQAKKFVPVDESQASGTTEVAAGQPMDSRGAVRTASGQAEFAAANAQGESGQSASGGTVAAAGKGQAGATP